ncbi:MAG: hypothetical protein PF501_02635 [Salinisphaera sp.]|jgi:hypothetical protein|nr:hypothetical protein [Salinisphaera sp.]
MNGLYLIRNAAAAACVFCLLFIAGCASRPSPPAPQPSPPPPTSLSLHSGPSDWIGRWVGTRQTFYLQILPTGRVSHYQLVFRDTYVRAQTFDARVTPNHQQLVFLRGGNRLTVSAGPSDQATGAPALDGLDDCLIVRSGDASHPPQAFCRRPATADALPVDRGTYVRARKQCWNAFPDDMLYFDGQGLARGGEQACHASLISQQGVIFNIAENCTDAASHKRTTEQQTITVADDRHFALQPFGGKTDLYSYCPGKPVPAWVKTARP